MTDRLKRMGPFLWHGAFLALTMAMIEPNTVLPALLSELTDSTVVFGFAYSILLGAPLVFSLWFSRWQQRFARKKKFLLMGISVRTASFVGLAAVTLFSATLGSVLTVILFLVLVFLFSVSGLKGVVTVLNEDRRFFWFIVLENITALSLMVRLTLGRLGSFDNGAPVVRPPVLPCGFRGQRTQHQLRALPSRNRSGPTADPLLRHPRDVEHSAGLSPPAGGLIIQAVGFVLTFLVVTLGMTAAFVITFLQESPHESH